MLNRMSNNIQIIENVCDRVLDTSMKEGLYNMCNVTNGPEYKSAIVELPYYTMDEANYNDSTFTTKIHDMSPEYTSVTGTSETHLIFNILENIELKYLNTLIENHKTCLSLNSDCTDVVNNLSLLISHNNDNDNILIVGPRTAKLIYENIIQSTMHQDTLPQKFSPNYFEFDHFAKVFNVYNLDVYLNPHNNYINQDNNEYTIETGLCVNKSKILFNPAEICSIYKNPITMNSVNNGYTVKSGFKFKNCAPFVLSFNIIF